MGDVKRISGLRRNAPAVPYRHKKRRSGEVPEEEEVGTERKTWDTKRQVKERERGSRTEGTSLAPFANLKSLQQLYDQLGGQR